jgi:hypothetical protein
MTKLVCGPFLPDQPAFANPGLVRAENVIPAFDHYLPFPSAVTLGLEGLSGQAEGMTVAFPTAGNPVLFTAFGGFLWRIPSLTLAPVNVSQNTIAGYSMNLGDRWRFVQYGNLQLATNYNDPVQVFDVSNVSGSFGDLTYGPRAKYITRIRDFVMLGYVNEDPDGEVPYRLRWHGINPATGLPDIEEWTISLETRSDFQDVSDLGEMMGLTGGRFGIALFRKGIARVDFGGQFLFEPHVIDDNIGCMVPGSVVRYGDETYFWGDEGIFKTNGGPAARVGTERVNRYLTRELDISRFDDVWAYPDYGRGIIIWTLPVVASSSSRLLIYRPALDRFSIAEVDVDSLGPMTSFGLDLDDDDAFPDLDTDERDLDDPTLWVTGALSIGAQIENSDAVYDYDEDSGDVVTFTGAPLPATLEWGEFEPGDGLRFVLNRGLAYHEGGEAQITIRSREKQSGDAANLTTFGPFSPQADGWFRFRVPSRFHRVRMTLSGNWSTVKGLDIRGVPLGQR